MGDLPEDIVNSTFKDIEENLCNLRDHTHPESKAHLDLDRAEFAIQQAKRHLVNALEFQETETNG